MAQPATTNPGLRGQIRVAVAALWTAVTVTTIAFDIPIPNREAVLAAWGGLFFAATGVAEAVFDSRRKA
jgi:hypothetical protein